MKKKEKKPLRLAAEVLRPLDRRELSTIAGGVPSALCPGTSLCAA